LPFGVAAIDRTLPGGGLARGALHEILGVGGDEEDGALAAAFTARILGRLALPTSPSQPCGPSPFLSPLKGGEEKQILSLSAPGGGEGRGEVAVVLWCLPRPDLYGPGLAAHGLDPGRVVLVRASRDAEILWAMEEGLRAPGIVAVVGEVGSLPMVASRRLQLAAERSGITAFLLRRWRDGGQAARERALPNAAVTRWRIAALPSRPLRDEPGVGHPRWRVELLRCRGGEPACWEMEVPDATDHVSLVAALADRPAAHVAAEKYRRAG
jgi:protein ImuA